MEEDVLREKLAEAKSKQQQAYIVTTILMVVGAILPLILPNISKTSITFYQILGMESGVLIGVCVGAVVGWQRDKEVKKYKEQLKGISRKRKKEVSREDPLEVLKLRLAKGKITKKEYEAMKKALKE
jgi:uncharacterized membrane protein